VAWRFADDIYTADQMPPRRAALILGALVHRSGRPSHMLEDRIRAGVDLYQQGKVEVLIMSGDHQGENYSEPEAMRRLALRLGVPENAILLDPKGFRTFDSCWRAKNVWGFREIVVVTQAFHLDRALLLCQGIGLSAVGLAADYQRPHGYNPRHLQWSRLREIPATTAAAIDLLRWIITQNPPS
jgi:SanA protein